MTTPEVQGYQTAIGRKTPPEPLRWLKRRDLIKGRALDYGSGRGCWYDMECYDPYWKPEYPNGKFDTIVCNYVLNVVDDKTQEEIIRNIRGLMKPGGTAYISVRRDLPTGGRSGRGTYQRYVVLPYESVSKNSTREIYRISNMTTARAPRIDVGVSKRRKTSKRSDTGLVSTR